MNKINRISKNAPADEYADTLLDVAKDTGNEWLNIRVAIAVWRMRTELTADKRKQAAEAILGMEKERDEYIQFVNDLNNLTK